MLVRAIKQSLSDEESTRDSQGDSLMANAELTGKRLDKNEALTHKGDLDPRNDKPCDKSKGKGKRNETTRLVRKKRRKMGLDGPSRQATSQVY